MLGGMGESQSEWLVGLQGRRARRGHKSGSWWGHRVGGLVGSWGQEDSWGHVPDLLVIEGRVLASVDGAVRSGPKASKRTDHRPCLGRCGALRTDPPGVGPTRCLKRRRVTRKKVWIENRTGPEGRCCEG